METADLYSGEDIRALRRGIARRRAAAAIVAGIGLCVCAILAATVTTENAGRSEIVCISVSTVAGWIAIWLAFISASAMKRELAHAEMLNSSERTEYAGTVTVTDEKLRIIRSIPIRIVTVTDEGGKTARLKVIESRAQALGQAGADAVYAANGYVAAYGRR